MISSWSEIRRILGKALTFNLQPASEDAFPELPTVLIWFRFLLAVVYGLYVGTKLIRSGVFLLQGFNLITFVPVMYCKFFLCIKGENVFGHEIVFSGLVNAVALCLLIWIYFFTAAHEAQEMELSRMLLSTMTDKSTSGDVDGEFEDIAEQDENLGGGATVQDEF